MESKRYLWLAVLLAATLPLTLCLQRAAPPAPTPPVTEAPAPEVTVEEIPEVAGEQLDPLGEIGEPELEANETVDLGSIL